MKLFEHQKKALNLTKGYNRCAYFIDMGLGKTFIGSEKAMALGKNILLVCQKSKIQDWMDHFEEHYPDDFAIDLTKKKDIKSLVYLVSNNEFDYKYILIINYELAFRRPDLLNLKNFTLMLDESSLIQNEKAKQSKFILKLNPTNVVLLSGTPCSGKYENLWSQCRLLGWDIDKKLFDTHYVEYGYLLDRYGNRKLSPTGLPIKVVVGYKNEERLKRKLRDYGAVFMKTEEVFELPEQTFINTFVEPSAQYKSFLKHSYVKMDDMELVGDTTLTKMLYSRMLCGRYSSDKLDALRDLLKSSDDRFIIFYNFNNELDSIIKVCEELNRPYSQVNGSVRDLEAYEKESNSITLVQYQAGAKGLNLQLANKIIYFTPTQSVENWMQSLKRIHRIGQKNTCFYYKMVVKNSIEEHIYAALEKGVDYTDALFESQFRGK